jgi:D-3-phosphoglycerate dehydrogenase
MMSQLIYVCQKISSSAKMSNSAVSVSPTTSALQDRFRAARDREPASTYILQPRILHPLENEEIKILLLENISQDAVGSFRSQAYRVDHYTKALSEDELVEKIGAYHAIGIRSKTKITERVLKSAKRVRSQHR